MENESTITINGGEYDGTYYINNNDVIYISKDFINTSDHTIYLYKNFNNENNEYISMPSMKYAAYHNGYRTNIIIKNPGIEFNNTAQFYRSRIYIENFMFTIIIISCIITMVRK